MGQFTLMLGLELSWLWARQSIYTGLSSNIMCTLVLLSDMLLVVCFVIAAIFVDAATDHKTYVTMVT